MTAFDGFEIDDSLETFESARNDLLKVELELGAHLNLSPLRPFRQQLVALDRANELVEDELVSEWHRLRSAFLSWLADDDADDRAPCGDGPDPPSLRGPIGPRTSKPEAAESGLAAFVVL